MERHPGLEIKMFTPDETDGFLTSNQSGLLPVLWNAVKELAAKVKDLKDALKKYESVHKP